MNGINTLKILPSRPDAGICYAVGACYDFALSVGSVIAARSKPHVVDAYRHT
jgi:hypothetical protein